jgi:hypothetical protein
LAPQHTPAEQRPAQGLPQPPQWLALLVGSTQAPPQLSWPVGQQRPPMHAPPGQSASAQHSELSMHASPHFLKPESHCVPHAPFAHVAVALGTVGHAVQLVAPHEFTLVFDRHRPAQSCVPAGHVPMHDAPPGMHAFAHTFCPGGQLAPHDAPSHVAVPPAGAGQAVHDVPHDAGDLSSTQRPLQAWKPAAHVKPHRWLALHVAVPLATAGQSAATQQLEPPRQMPPQRW